MHTPSWLMALAAGLLFAAGCEDMTRPDPPPVAEVFITAEGAYRIDGRPIDGDRLDAELSRRAKDAMNPKLSRTSLQVRIGFAPGVDYAGRVVPLMERCQQLGISNVETQR